MSEWRARRFWSDVGIRPDDGGWAVTLDGKPLHTPGKLTLLLPSKALAKAIAEEWRAQTGVIEPLTMPLTRAANSAVERVTPQHAAVAGMLSEYGAADLLCYRAKAPPSLVARQVEAWDPLLVWAAELAGTRLTTTQGIVHVTQPAAALAPLRQRVEALDPFALTALHDLVTLPASLVLGLAVLAGRISADDAHHLSRIDEVFQAEQWGFDDEAQQAAEARLEALRVAETLFLLSRPDGPAAVQRC